MTSNRVGGPSSSEPGKEPDHRLQQQHRRIEKVEKVKAVDEAENERTRKRFRNFMEDDEEESNPKKQAPSPFETSFHKQSSSPMMGAEEGPQVFFSAMTPPPSLGDMEEDAVPSPAYSPTPDVTQVPIESQAPPPLPQSQNFWSNVDEPSDQPLKSPKFEETERSSSQTQDPKNKSQSKPQGKDKESAQEKKKKETHSAAQITPTEPFQKTAKGKSELEASTKNKKLKTEKENEPIQAPSPWKEEIDFKHLKKPSEKELKKENAIFPGQSLEEIRKDNLEREKEREDQGKSHTKSQKILEIESPSLTTLPSQAVTEAQAAVTEATPFLSPQTIPLFFQMVGTIYVMTGPATPGVSKTEIVLNAPSFANSKFFGATISIEKYATAPDALNIRLTGSNEAVSLFHQNIPNLYAAFQNGNFKFRIGRITAEYEIEKPLFRRKESGTASKDTDAGGDHGGRNK